MQVTWKVHAAGDTAGGFANALLQDSPLDPAALLRLRHEVADNYFFDSEEEGGRVCVPVRTCRELAAVLHAWAVYSPQVVVEGRDATAALNASLWSDSRATLDIKRAAIDAALADAAKAARDVLDKALARIV